MDKSFIESLANPGNEFRGAPFWAWNGKLDPDELRRQVRMLYQMGLGGFFMHARVGLDSEYLGKDWFDGIRAAVDEAKALDMRAWMYDEDRWPSGAAGGLVTKDPKYRRRYLAYETVKASGFRRPKNCIAAFAADIHKGKASNVQFLKPGQTPKIKTQSVVVFVAQLEACREWHNGYTYLDVMNPKAVQEFIRVTHEAYRREMGEEFGRRAPGMFTDEPNHGHYFQIKWDEEIGAHSIPWTDRLPQVFEQRYGYDIIPRLIEVVYDSDAAEDMRARRDYHDCTTHLFVDAFARQIGEWCEKHGIDHTGHVLAEGCLISQSMVVGSCMRFYEHMQAPGMDLLTEYNREYGTAKAVASIARQFGRKWRLTETYGCTGWDFPWAGHKALSDWQAALGINLRCQHLSWYTMEGEAKRDYPASIFYQSPWWEHYSKVEDYFGRIHCAMTRGEEVRDVLVIQPLESVWVNMRQDWPSQGLASPNTIDKAFEKTYFTLLAHNQDHDFGDEDIMARHGKVQKTADGPLLKINKASYRCVVVPLMCTMRSSTLNLLKRFRKAGGAVIFVDDAPPMVDARLSDAAERFARQCIIVSSEGDVLPEMVTREAGRRVSITDPEGREIPETLYLLREDKDAHYLFICNTGEHDFKHWHSVRALERKAEYPQATVTLYDTPDGAPLEVDLDTGEWVGVRRRKLKNRIRIETSFPKLGSRLFIFPKRAVKDAPKTPRALKNVRAHTLNPKAWDVTLSEPNVLVLDRPMYRLNNRRWRGPEEILRLDRKVRESLGLKARGGQMTQPWARKKRREVAETLVELSYGFNVQTPPSDVLYLAVEAPDSFCVCVNGTPLSMDGESGWWCDRSLRKIPIDPSLITMGENEIHMICDYTEDHPGLEIIYLLGRFGVDVNDTEVTMTRPTEQLKLGDWTRQGLPFYAGNVGYNRTINPTLKGRERLFIKVPSYDGIGVRVLVDGQEAGIIAWEPNEMEITGFVCGRPIRLALEVLGHRRNSHGPLHNPNRYDRWYGPRNFVTQGKDWIDGYMTVPCGLNAPPKLVVRK